MRSHGADCLFSLRKISLADGASVAIADYSVFYVYPACTGEGDRVDSPAVLQPVGSLHSVHTARVFYLLLSPPMGYCLLISWRVHQTSQCSGFESAGWRGPC